MLPTHCMLTGLLMLSVTGISHTAIAEDTYKGTLSDAHGHLRPKVETKWVINSMDANDVDIAVIMGRAGVTDAEVLEFHREHRDRIIPAIGMQNDGWRTQDESFLSQSRDSAASGKYRWIGETSLRGNVNGKLFTHPEHKAVHTVMELSAKYGLPVTFHHNSFDPNEVKAFLSVVGKYPKATVVWAHFCGLSDPEKVESWLKKYTNLHCDLAWLHKHQEDFPVQLVDDESWFLPRWKTLIEKYPTRFLIGIDASKKKHYMKKYDRWIEKIRTALGGLKPDVAEQVATKNLHRLLGKTDYNKRGLKGDLKGSPQEGR